MIVKYVDEKTGESFNTMEEYEAEQKKKAEVKAKQDAMLAKKESRLQEIRDKANEITELENRYKKESGQKMSEYDSMLKQFRKDFGFPYFYNLADLMNYLCRIDK